MSEKVGSAEILLLLNRQRFDSEIRLLERLNIKPLAVSVTLNRGQLDRELKLLERLSVKPITVPVQTEQRQPRSPSSGSNTPRTALKEFKTKARSCNLFKLIQSIVEIQDKGKILQFLQNRPIALAV